MQASPSRSAERWLSSPTARLALAAIAGGLLPPAFAPLCLWPLGFCSLALLYVLIGHSASARGAFTVGGAFGLACFGTGSSWIHPALAHHAGLGELLAAAGTAVFVLYLSLFGGIACMAAHWLRRGPNQRWPMPAIFASAWTAAEWLRGLAFGGYTFLDIGYTHVDGPLRSLAPIVGTYGLTWLTALLAAASADAVRERRPARLALVPVTIVLIGWAASGIRWTEPFGRPIEVRLLQPNAGQATKFDPRSLPGIIDDIRARITARPADLVIAPETALPVYLHELPAGFVAALRQFAADTRSTVAFGIATVRADGNAANSMVGIVPTGPDGALYRYEKAHLMPFGEYAPTGFGWFVDRLAMPLKDLSAGSPSQDTLPVAGQRIAFMICQEEMFGEEVARWTPEATVVVNPSNLAWFEGSLALPQSLQMARMRALEIGRPIVRVANTGITAIIGEDGRLVAQLPPGTADILQGTVAGRRGMTPFSRWRNAPVITLAFGALAAAAAARLRGRRAAGKPELPPAAAG